jgi:hypothetical protein
VRVLVAALVERQSAEALRCMATLALQRGACLLTAVDPTPPVQHRYACVTLMSQHQLHRTVSDTNIEW